VNITDQKRMEWLLANVNRWAAISKWDNTRLLELCRAMIEDGLYEAVTHQFNIKYDVERLIAKARIHAILRGIIEPTEDDLQRVQRTRRLPAKGRESRKGKYS
jgi:uncharacterized protein with FMN-binding domain